MGAVSTRRLAMFLGGTFLAGAGLFAAACGTDNGTSAVPTVDSGGRDTSSSSSSSGSSGDPDGSGPTDGGADCANIPTPKSSDGPFCFSVLDASPDGSTASKNCNAAANEVCCSGQRIDGGPTFEPSRCEVATPAGGANAGYNENTVCNAGFTYGVEQWHCMESAHCPGNNEVCCAITADAGQTLIPQQDKDFPGCPVYFQNSFFAGGTRCKSACAAGELIMCASDADCQNGKCVPITIEGRYGGYCRL